MSNENHTVRVHPTGMIFEGKCAVRGAACSAAVGIAPITAVRVEGTAETVNVCRACFEEQVDSRMWVVREVVRDNVQTAARVMQEKLDGLTAARVMQEKLDGLTAERDAARGERDAARGERDETRRALIEVTQKYVDAEARAAAVPPETAALYAQAAREVVVKGTAYDTDAKAPFFKGTSPEVRLFAGETAAPVTHEYPDVYDCGSWPAHGTEHGKDLPTICNELHAKGREVVQAWDHHGDGNRGWTVLHRARAK